MGQEYNNSYMRELQWVFRQEERKISNNRLKFETVKYKHKNVTLFNVIT
jgi:hypothetical protein